MESPGNTPARTPTSWDADDDALLMHLKDLQKLGWKEIASNFTNRTPNACQFRWRRLKLGNLKNPPKLAIQAAARTALANSTSPETTTRVSPVENSTPAPAAHPTTPHQPPPTTPFAGVSQLLTFTGYDNSVSNALAGLNALLNTPSLLLTPQSFTPQHGASPNPYGEPLDPPPNPPRGPHTGGGYYAEISVDPTMNLPQNQPHPPLRERRRRSSTLPDSSTESGATDGENLSLRRSSAAGDPKPPAAANVHIPVHIHSMAAHRRALTVLPALHSNLIIQIAKDDRTSVLSITRASVLLLPLKLMNIPHHQLGNNALAHLPVLFGGAGGSISGPSPTPSVSGPPGIHLKEVASLRSSSVGLTAVPTGTLGYFLRLGSVVIPHNGEKRVELERKTPERRKDTLVTTPAKSGAGGGKKSIFKIPWSMEEDELLINRRNRELLFAELLILLPQRTEGEIWSRIDHLERLSNGHRERDTKRRQSLIGLDDVDGFYDVIDSDDDDDDDDVLMDVEEVIRRKKRRASSAVNPLAVDRKMR